MQGNPGLFFSDVRRRFARAFRAGRARGRLWIPNAAKYSAILVKR